MNPETGSNTPEQAPAQPAPSTEATPATPASSPEPTPPATPAPVEGSAPATPEPAAPAEPKQEPQQPRESAAQRRAREVRDKAAGLSALADRLDPPAPSQPAPPQQPAPLPTQTPTAPALVPDYFDPNTGEIDIEKHADYTRRVAQAEAQRLDAARQQQQQQTQAQANFRATVDNYVTTLNADAAHITSTMPELNPASPEYDQDLDDHITAAYERATTNSQGQIIRTDISLKDFAEKEVAIVRKYRTQGAANVPNAQAAQGMDNVIAPGSGKAAPAGKSVDDMSAKEYEDYLKSKGTKTVQR